MTKLGNRFGWNALLLMTTAFTAFGIASEARAQSEGVEEVIITGTKRAENMQDVPISV